jgi:hypothetical protein
VPDEVRDGVPAGPAAGATQPAGPPPSVDQPAAPPVAAPPAQGADGHPKRRPSWLRAVLWSLVVLIAGVALGAAGYHAERSAGFAMPIAERTDTGWLLSAPDQHELTGLGLSGGHLIWQDGASIEYMDLDRGKVLLLGPGPEMRTTWDPAISDTYAIWFEAERSESVAAQAVVYDISRGRRWVRAEIGSVNSYPAVSGDRAVWSSAVDLGEPAVWGVQIGGDEPPYQIAPGYGAPVVSGNLVVWARSWTGPFTAKEIETGVTWRAADGLTNGKLTGLALFGRTLVWGQSGAEDGSGVVAACDVDGGRTRAVAEHVTGLSGPAYDGRAVVWGEKAAGGSRLMARRLDDGDAFVVATTAGTVTEVAVSDHLVAWIQHDASGYAIVVRELPR